MADNLLDKASILLTPTAYNDGSMLSVKPENGDGDFTFSRSSAATRVNAQGLVENVQIISSELVSNGNFSQIGTEEVSNGNFSQEGSEIVTNGDFSNGSSNWVKSTNVYISTSSCNFDNTSDNTASCFIQQSGVLQSTKSYKVTINVSSYISGDLKIIGVTGSPSFEINQQGQYILFVNSTQSNLAITVAQSGVDCNLTIDNVSVKEVGQDWFFVGEAELTEQGARIYSSSGGQSYINQDALTNTKSYKISYDIVDSTQGALKLINVNGVSDYPIPSTVGSHIVYFTANNNTLFIYRNSGATDVTITNISVKEVGQDWTFGTNTTISEENGSLKAMIDGANGLITQVSVVDANKKYRASFDLKYISGIGAIKFEIGGFDSGFIAANLGENNTYTYDFTTTNTGSLAFRSGGNAIEGYITNVSVKEITDDTDLPRINYEGFSYQDALGSEEIVNGGFDTNLNNWVAYSNTLISWESGGYALLDSNNNYWCKIKQSNVFEIGKTYKVILTAKSDRTDLSFHNSPITGSFSEADTFETFEQYYTATTTDFLFGYANAGSATITIDNISVKEVIGQEVVPDSGCGSWLLEPQSTNLVTYSSDYSQSGWVNTGLTINNNASVSPEGASNATKIIATTANSRHDLTGVFATGNSTDMISCFVKKSGYNYVQIASWANPSNYVNFDLINGLVGSIGTTPPTNYGIKDYGNGWYRIYANVQASGGGIFGIGIVTSASAGWAQSFTGNGTDGIEIWGAQVEQQSYPTSYIPTNGATNTRLQDIATNSGNSTLINSTEGVLYAETAALANTNSYRLIDMSDGGSINRIYLAYTNSNNKIRVVVRVSNSDQFDYQYTLTDATEFNKIAFKYKENDFALWVNGTEVYTDSSGITFPSDTLNVINFSNTFSTENFFVKAKAVAVFKEALTDAQLQSLTTI